MSAVRRSALAPAVALGCALGCGSKEPPPRPAGPAASAGDAPAPSTVDAAPAVDAAQAPVDDTAARVAAAQAVIAAGTDCLPADDPDEASRRRLVAAPVDGAVVACLVEEGERPVVGPLACWTVEPTTAALTYQPPRLLPGVGVAVRLDARGCAYGACRPGGAGDERGAVVALSTDGDRLALGPPPGQDAPLVAHVVDVRSHAVLRAVALDGPAGLTNSFDGLVFVGTTLFARGVDAGPWAGVWAVSAGEVALVDGSPLRHDNDPPRDPYGNVFGGGLHVLDRTRALVSARGLARAVVADAGRHRLTEVAGKGGCTPAELDALLVDEPVSARCRRFAAELARLADAAVTAGPDGTWLALSLRRAELRVLDPARLTTRRTLAMPRCR